MLGPLPKLYRILVALTALLVCAVGGAWAAFMIPYPILLSAGASVGLAVGAGITYLLVHGTGSHPEPQRIRRRDLH